MIIAVWCLTLKTSDMCWNLSYVPISVARGHCSSGMCHLVAGWVVRDGHCSGLNFKSHSVQWRNVPIKKETFPCAWYQTTPWVSEWESIVVVVIAELQTFLNLNILWTAETSWHVTGCVAGCASEPVWKQLRTVVSLPMSQIGLPVCTHSQSL
jgi:hypothetical protein